MLHPASRRSGRERAFTLVELLVVISVIVILMSMVMPALMGASAKAREVKCLSNLNQLGKAIINYSGNFDGFIPAPAFADELTDADIDTDAKFSGIRTESTSAPEKYDSYEYRGGTKYYYIYTSQTWRGKIVPYVGTVSLNEEERYQVYRCPSVRSFRKAVSGTIINQQSFYGMQAYMAMYAPQNLKDPPNTGIIKTCHYDDMPNPANTFLLGENNDGHWAVKPKYLNAQGDFTAKGQVYTRHSQRSTWVFAEGHCVAMTMTQAHERGLYYWLLDKPEATTP